jgi:CysZ protein
MLAAAVKALSQIFSPAFRGVLLRSVALTLALLAAVWVLLFWLLGWLVDVDTPWLETALQIITGIGLLVGLGFLVAPVTAAFAGLFLDDIAEAVERADYPHHPPGRAVPLGEGLLATLRFTLVVIGVNILVLLLLLVPGINIFAFVVANAYLLGREYFEAVAMRFHSRETAVAMRAENSTRIFLAGVLIALLLAIPIVNLLTPLFATAFMVHIYKGLPQPHIAARTTPRQS